MKALRVILVFASFAVAHAEESRGGIRSPFERPVDLRLDGTTAWRMDSGDTLKIVTSDGSVDRLVGPGGTIFEISQPEHIEQAVLSRSASCLLFRVLAARASGGSDHSRLVRVSRDAHGRWAADTLFAHDAPPMNELHRWVSELGAISDTGRKALLKIHEANQEATPYRMRYVWQTWLLDRPKKLSDGIRVSDDFDK